jgi:arylsulfatase A-like enzyme
MRKSVSPRCPLFLIVIGTLAVVLFAGCSGDATPPKHLLLLTLDTLRPDHLGIYGSPNATSPVLDALAKRGIRFDDAISQAISTSPSHASILTGLYPQSHGLRVLARQRLAADNLSMAEILKERGFTTAAFVSGIPLRSEQGLDQGFDFYEDSFKSEGRERKAGATNEKVKAWLDDQKSLDRLFLWVHYFDPHARYDPPDPFWPTSADPKLRHTLKKISKNRNPDTGNRRFKHPPPGRVDQLKSLYDAEIRYTDHSVGELLEMLEAKGLISDMVIAAVSDHGECLGEYGYFFNHWDVYRPTAAIPMILVHPYQRKWSGRSVDDPVATIDLLPTLLAWLGIPAPRVEGIDLTPLIEGKPGPDRSIYTEQIEFFPAYAVRNGDFLHVHRVDKEATFNRALLRATDGDLDRSALASDHPAHASLKNALDAFRDPARARESVDIDLPADVKEKLRALGYYPDREHRETETRGTTDRGRITQGEIGDRATGQPSRRPRQGKARH